MFIGKTWGWISFYEYMYCTYQLHVHVYSPDNKPDQTFLEMQMMNSSLMEKVLGTRVSLFYKSYDDLYIYFPISLGCKH